MSWLQAGSQGASAQGSQAPSAVSPLSGHLRPTGRAQISSHAQERAPNALRTLPPPTGALPSHLLTPPRPAVQPQPAVAQGLQEAVQAALQDLLSVAGLQHEDSWDVTHPADPPAPPQAPAGPLPSRGSGSGGRMSRPGAAPQHAAEERAPGDAELGLCASMAGEEGEHDLPPAAALRLCQARLRVAQADLASLQVGWPGGLREGSGMHGALSRRPHERVAYTVPS